MSFLKKLGISAVLPSLGLSAMDFATEKYRSDLQAKENKEVMEWQRGENAAAFERNRAFEFEKLGIDRANALNDWNRQNEYNSPKAQVARMVEGGLNPNLMYGQGTTGNAAVISAPALGEANYDAPVRESVSRERVSPLESIAQYFRVKNMGLENQNLAAQNSILKWRGVTEEQTARALHRENELLEKTGASSRDNFMIRHGSRLIKWLRSRDWEGSNRDIENGVLSLPKGR